MLFSLDLRMMRKRATLQMRWYPYISIWAMLALTFVIPHDPSSSLAPHQVGSEAFSMTPRGGRMRPTASSGITMQQQQLPQHHATPAAPSASCHLLDEAHSTPDSSLRRLVRLARARPHLVVSIVRAALRTRNADATGDESGLIEEGEPLEEVTTLEVISTNYNNTSLGWSTTVEELRAEYGARRRWWGDYSPRETRALYHALLPKSLLDEDAAEAAEYSLAQRAELAIAARRAARLYARERAILPYALGSELLDGVRTLLEGGRFRKEGYSEEQIWEKYAGCLPSDLPDGAGFSEDVYLTILQKACSTNQYIDRMCGQCATEMASAAAQAGSVPGGGVPPGFGV